MYNAAPVPVREVSWPVVAGVLPVLATAFQERRQLRERIGAARTPGGDRSRAETDRGSGQGPGRVSDVVLTQVLSGGGGTGKSQLAASYADRAVREGVDLVVWVSATDVESVIASYGQAAALVGLVPGAGSGDGEADARTFRQWLAGTARSWLLVLDDISDPPAMLPWWPASHPRTGWVLATTRRRDPVLSGGSRALIDVDVYTDEESQAYLRERLAGAGYAASLDEHAGDLARALAHLPLALSHAAAYMIDQARTCGDYLDRYTDRRRRLDELMPASMDTDAYGRAVATTWSLSITAADASHPHGMATPAIQVAALLDPAGHPAHLWNSAALASYLKAHLNVPSRPHTGPDADPAQPAIEEDDPASTQSEEKGAGEGGDVGWEAMRTLNRYGLITFDPGTALPTVRVHALTQRAVRDTMTPEAMSAAAHAAADALLSLWPDLDLHRDKDLITLLRANTTSLSDGPAATALWQPAGHPLLYRTGKSLQVFGFHDTAVTYWHTLHHVAEYQLGAEHPDTLNARAYLAGSYWSTGRTGEAINLMEQVLADAVRLLGAEHLDTLTVRAHLASSYQSTGRTEEAIDLQEQVLADRVRLLGAEHRHILSARANLAYSYQSTGRTEEAIDLQEQVLADRVRLLGAEHPHTLITRANLAYSYQSTGRIEEAIDLQEQVLADSIRLLGAEHPDTLTARANLASSYRSAGRTGEATALQEQVLADRMRLLGAEHPNTTTARSVLTRWRDD